VTGAHTISFFLNRNAARQGQVANYDIPFEVTSGDTSEDTSADFEDHARRVVSDNPAPFLADGFLE
jgi:hypothetical protein